jgi:hypothetical protein
MDTIKIIELPGRSSAERDDWKEAAAGRQNMPMEGVRKQYLLRDSLLF